MATTINSVEDVVNYALQLIGYKNRIGSIFEGSEASVAALDVYATVRDQLLREGDHGFSERSTSPILLKSAPPQGYIPPTVWSNAYPPLPWLFEYTYPEDCLKVRSVKATPMILPNFDPQPQNFSVVNDTGFIPAKKAIVCNIPYVVLTYTGQVTDVTAWEPLFVESFASSLARLIGPTLGRMDQVKLEDAKMTDQETSVSAAISNARRG